MPIQNTQNPDVFTFLFGNQNQLLIIAISLVGVILAIQSYQRSKRSLVAKDRLINVISPMFYLLEPYMLRASLEPDQEVWVKVILIIEEQKLFAGGRLVEYLEVNPKSKSFQRNFQSLCKEINQEFDSLCRELSIPLRRYEFRLSRYKFRYSVFPLIFMLMKAIINLLIFAIAFILFIGFLSLVAYYSAPHIEFFIRKNPTIITIICVILMIAINVFFPRTKRNK